MKGYYIHFGAKNGSAGVAKKIDMQIKEFSKYYDMEEIDVQDIPGGKLNTLADLTLFWVSRDRDYSAALSRIIDPDFVYMRRATADRAYIGFISEIRRRYPKCKIIVEIFTYPYDKDSYDAFLLKMLLCKERHYRKKYKDCIDRFVTYSEDEEIFGVKTIRTMNGMDVASESVVPWEKKDNHIHLIFVAYMQKHHGFERLLYGMKEYYASEVERDVICHCVGDGPELSAYKRMAEEFGIEDKIIFYGKRNGKELDEVYDKADFAVSSLGLYKIGIYMISPLKIREYLAKGLPVISGCDVDIFKRYPCDFHVDFPNDGTAIDFHKIVECYDKLLAKYGDRRRLIHCIRDYAEQYADNSMVMKPIIDFAMDKEEYHGR